ncbi:MAG: chemotaxis protein CheW [Bacteroidales bacterium]|nr:chemotaxis protein CheW [Bacteroidales bacterium]MDD4603200.1 chemotaxis protein CheW [Bacteroidales bacterium]
MDLPRELFCFTIDDQRYALPLMTIDRVLQSLAVSIIPNAPPLVYGVIDLFGHLVPVINLRYRLKLPAKVIGVNDFFVVVDTPKRKLALVIDEIEDMIVVEAQDIVPGSNLDPGLEAKGILRIKEGIVFIYDIETLISEQEEEIIKKVLDDSSK